MDVKRVSKSPVLSELSLLLLKFDADPDPETGDFQFCRALTKSTAKQRRIPTSEAKQALATELLASFKDLKEIPEDDNFYNRVRNFLVATHCSRHHVRKACAEFEEWKMKRSSLVHAASSLESGTVVNGSSLSKSIENDSTIAAPISDPDGSLFASSPPAEGAIRHNISRKPVPPKVIDEVTAGISEITITANQALVKEMSDGNALSAEEMHLKHILGVTSPRRSGSVRDQSPIIQALNGYHKDSEQKVGIVYVYQHEKIDGLFKIGWTTRDEQMRRNDRFNCYAINTTTIYQSVTPFFGALRAEHLAQTILRHHNLYVTKCSQCNGGHREWFKAPREMVCSTVKLMEDFVRLPGYERWDDGTWKVSTLGHQLISEFCNFSVDRMRVLIDKEGGQGPVDATLAQSAETETRTSGKVIAVVPEPLSSPSAESNTPDHDTLESSQVSSMGSTSQGARKEEQESASKRTGKFVRRLKNRISRGSARSKENGPPDTVNEATVQQQNIEGMAVKFVLHLLPKQMEAKVMPAQENQTYEFSSLREGLVRVISDELAELKSGYYENMEEADKSFRA